MLSVEAYIIPAIPVDWQHFRLTENVNSIHKFICLPRIILKMPRRSCKNVLFIYHSVQYLVSAIFASLPNKLRVSFRCHDATSNELNDRLAIKIAQQTVNIDSWSYSFPLPGHAVKMRCRNAADEDRLC